MKNHANLGTNATVVIGVGLMEHSLADIYLNTNDDEFRRIYYHMTFRNNLLLIKMMNTKFFFV